MTEGRSQARSGNDAAEPDHTGPDPNFLVKAAYERAQQRTQEHAERDYGPDRERDQMGYDPLGKAQQTAPRLARVRPAHFNSAHAFDVVELALAVFGPEMKRHHSGDGSHQGDETEDSELTGSH